MGMENPTGMSSRFHLKSIRDHLVENIQVFGDGLQKFVDKLIGHVFVADQPN